MRRLLGFALLLFPVLCWAQPQEPDTLWTRTLGGFGDDFPCAIHHTHDGGAVLAGTAYFSGQSIWDWYVVKLSADGEVEWQHTFGSLEADTAVDVRELRGGGYVVLGKIGLTPVSAEMRLLRLDADGDSLWERAYHVADRHEPVGVVELPGGDFLIASNAYGQAYPGVAYQHLIRTSAAGEVLASEGSPQPVGIPLSRFYNRLKQYDDGEILLAGIHSGWRPIPIPPYAIPFYVGSLTGLDSTGSVQWTDYDPARLQGFVPRGSSGCRSAGGFWLLSEWSLFLFNGNGAVVDSFLAYGFLPWDLEPHSGGGVAVVTVHSSFDTTNQVHHTNVGLTAYSISGSIAWQSLYNEVGGTDGTGVMERLPDGGFAIATTTTVGSTGGKDILVIRTASALAAPQLRGDQPRAFALGPVYPNPFNPTTQITFELPKTERVTLSVFDVLGKEVAVLKDGMVPAGRHAVTFDGSRAPSGIYFIRLQAAGTSQILKAALVK